LTANQIKSVFKRLYKDIRGDTNPDIITYRDRSKIINRDVFLREMVWAIWAAGKSRVSNERFLERALQKGFAYDFKVVASWDKTQQDQFLKSLHSWTNRRGCPYKRPVPQGAINRWNSIFIITKELVKCKTEQAFRDKIFGGKTESILLDISDIHRLVSFKIPYLKEVTAHFLIKNMGAEAIKADIWINEFLIYSSLSKYELEQLLVNTNIPFGLFDTVL
jgi:hypothetical protein